MKIAVIGYGSLIWDLDDLAPKVSGDWQRGTGPAMPVEFTRVSPKRKRALALVIHQDVPRPSATSYIMSNSANLDQAIEDLALRERTEVSHIGYAAEDGRAFSRNPGVAEAVTTWLGQSGCSAAVWTDLDGNFTEHTGSSFSHQTGRDYLKTLTGESLYEAWRYITYAPSETDTPFRRFLLADTWWNGLNEQFAG